MKRMLQDNGDKPHREGFFELMSRLNHQSKNEKTPENGDKIKLDKKDMAALFLSALFTLTTYSASIIDALFLPTKATMKNLANVIARFLSFQRVFGFLK